MKSIKKKENEELAIIDFGSVLSFMCGFLLRGKLMKGEET